MRVPSLFIIDEILKISMGLPNSSPTATVISVPSTASSTAAVAEPESLVNATLNATLNAATAAATDFLTGGSGMEGPDADNALRDDIEFYKFISLTTLKFLLCLFGKYSIKIRSYTLGANVQIIIHESSFSFVFG